ncbi:MAG: 50S ribosomal protein L15 [Thermoguttaceae bacterium]
MKLNEVNSGVQKHSPIKRLGRGTGSGLGKTAGRGHKGQGSRAGFSMPAYFEGGQMPLARRIPKRGFHNRFADNVAAINVGDLDLLFENGDTISPQILVEEGIIKVVFDQIKILGDGELTKSLTVMSHKFSATAKSKIEAAGGKIVELPGPKPVVKNKMKPKKAKV